SGGRLARCPARGAALHSSGPSHNCDRRRPEEHRAVDSRAEPRIDKGCEHRRAVRAMTGHDEDFAAMFEASIKAKRFEKGQMIEGKIVAIGPEVAFVDVGGKGEATIEVDELKDDEGALEIAVGD